MKHILFSALALLLVSVRGEAAMELVDTVSGVVGWKLVGETTKFDHMGIATRDGFVLLRLVGITTYDGIEFKPLEGYRVSCVGLLTKSRETLIVRSVDSCMEK